MIVCSPFSRFLPFKNFCRLSRLSCTASVDSFSGRSLSFVSMMSGNKGGQSSLDKSKKLKIVPVWRPISADSEYISKIVKSGSSDPIEDSVNCEKSRRDESTVALAVTFSSEAVDFKSEREPLEGKGTTPFSCKEEKFPENHDNDETTLTNSNRVIQQVKITRETTLAKFNKDSEIINRAGKYSVSLQVDAPLIRLVKGKWSFTLKQIEGETSVKIIFPSAKNDSSIGEMQTTVFKQLIRIS